MKHLLRFKTFLLMAIFSLLAGTSAWAQSDFSSTETSNVTLTAGTNGSKCTVNGKDGIKVGTSSKGGDMSVTVPAGTKYLHLHAAAWKGVNSLSLNISEATVSPASISLSPDVGVSNNSPFTLSGNASDFYFVIELSNITTETTLKFTTSTTKRFVIWGVNAEEESGTGGDTSVATTVTIDASGITNTDVYAGTDAGSLTATVSTDEGAISGAIVTWSGNNDAVATIDASTGAVTLVAAGSVTFTASYAGVEDTYKPSSKTYVMTVTNNDPTIPGTENNPYTVAQARAAIDAGSGTQGVYATGIVSAIPTAYNSQHSNITFNFVDNDGDTDFLQAYRCGGTDAADVQVGDIVVVYGNLTKYGSTYEFGQGCEVVSITHPVVAVATPTFDPVAGAYSEPQNVTISCATDGADIYYTTDGTEPDANSTPFTGAINVATTTTIKAIAYKGGESSAVAKGTYHITSVDNPYTVSQALGFDDSEYPIEQIYVHGIVSTAPTQAPTNYGQLTYYISDDGTTTNQLQVYKGQGLNAVEFTSQDDIQVGDEVTIIGNVKIYNNAKEFDTGNYLVAFNRPVVATPSITVNIPNPADVNADGGDNEFEVTYTNLAADPQLAVVFCDANGDAVADGTYNWITATYNATSGKIDGHIDVNTGDARTAYFKVSGKDANDNTVYSELITINQSAYNPSINIKTEGAIEFDATGGSKTLGVDYESLGSNPTFELQFFEYDGTTETQCGWITYSFASNDNKVTITGLNNDEGAARTAYFKVYAEVNKTKVYSNLVTVNQAAPVVDYATLPFAFDGGRADIENTSGLTQEGLDSDYGSSPKLKFNGSDDAVILKINERPGTLTFDIKGNPSNNVWAGTFKVQTSEDGMTYTDFATYTDLTSTVQNESFDNLDENVRYIKWIYTEKSSGNVALGNITVAQYVAPVLTPSITITPATINAKANDNGGELTVTCENLAATPNLQIVFCDANGDAVANGTYDWISAEFNSNGNIDGILQPNTGDARTAYLVVTGVDADNNVVKSNLVTINQAAPAAPSITVEKGSIDFVAGGESDRKMSFEYESLGNSPSFEVVFFDELGTTVTTYDWVTTATIENNEKVNLSVAQNDGAARTAYFKVHETATDVYSNLVTISQAAPTTDYVTLPFNWAGGASADLTAIAGVTASGIGSDYGATHDPYLVKFDSDGDYIQFKTNEQPGVVTIGVKMIGGGNTSTITVQGSADGDKFTDIEKLTISGKQNDFLTLATTNEFDSSVRYIRLNFTKGSNVGVGPISIALPALVATPTFDPAAGEVQAGTLVTISTTTVNATIRYTTDGSEPTTLHGEEYDKPIVINSAVTIKAIAVDDNWNVSAVAEATYTIATSSQLSPELTLDPKSLNVTEGAANGTVTVTTAAGYNGTITVMVDDPSVADASYDAGVITVVYGHAGSAVISVTAGADGDYVEQMEQISVNVSAPVQPAQPAVVVWNEDWSSFDLTMDEETPAANAGFAYAYTNGDSATKLYDDNLAGCFAPELLINKNGGSFTATIPLYGAYGNMKLTFQTNYKLSEVRAKVDDGDNNEITVDPTTVGGKYVYVLPFNVAEGANQVVLTFTNSSTSKNVRIDNFKLTAPQVAVKISAVEYATMYYASSNLVVPAGVTASTYWVDGDLLKVSQEYTEGAVLAKAQGYILNGAPGSYTFTATNDAANEDPKNLLCGSDVAVTTTAPVAGNFLFYLLGVDNGKVGFYWGKAEGAAFTSGAHKAYLAVPTEQASGLRGFSFDGSVVGINTIGVDMPEGNAYDLQGRRVQQFQKNGLYIVDGKKMLAK